MKQAGRIVSHFVFVSIFPGCFVKMMLMLTSKNAAFPSVATWGRCMDFLVRIVWFLAPSSFAPMAKPSCLVLVWLDR